MPLYFLFKQELGRNGPKAGQGESCRGFLGLILLWSRGSTRDEQGEVNPGSCRNSSVVEHSHAQVWENPPPARTAPYLRETRNPCHLHHSSRVEMPLSCPQCSPDAAPAAELTVWGSRSQALIDLLPNTIRTWLCEPVCSFLLLSCFGAGLTTQVQLQLLLHLLILKNIPPSASSVDDEQENNTP